MTSKATRGGLRIVPIANVYPNPDQPRKLFEQGALDQLADSIARSGLLQPVTVRADDAGELMIVCGERRYRACLQLGHATIRVLVSDMSDEALADAAMIENLQRLDITPMEEAHAFQARLDQGVTVAELAARLGLKPFRIAWRVALLKLAPEYQNAFEIGLLEQNQANHLSRLSVGYQRLLFEAIRAGRCKRPNELRAVCEALQAAERRNAGEPAPLELTDALEPDQRSLFADTGPTAQERATLADVERKIEAVVALLGDGFKDNEVVIVQKVSRANADTMADRLELVEQHLRKLRLALRASAAVLAA